MARPCRMAPYGWIGLGLALAVSPPLAALAPGAVALAPAAGSPGAPAARQGAPEPAGAAGETPGDVPDAALTDEAAAQLKRARAVDLAVIGHGGDQPALPVLRKIEAETIRALKLAPGSATVAARLRAFYERWLWQIPSPAAELLVLVAQASDPESLALRLADSETETVSNLSTEIVLAALAVRPRSAALWSRAARLAIAPAWKLALLAEAGRHAGAPPGDPAALDAAAGIAANRLALLFELGLAPEMLRAVAELPGPVREAVARGGPRVSPLIEPPLRDPPSAAESAGRRRDLRLELAAAHLLTGDAAGGRVWAAHAGLALAAASPGQLAVAAAGGAASGGHAVPSIWDSWRDPEFDEEHPLDWQPEDTAVHDDRQMLHWQQLIVRWLVPAPESDAFPLLTSSILDERFVNPGWEQVVAGLARREGYPGIAAFMLERAATVLARQSEVPSYRLPSGAAPDPWPSSAAVPLRVRQDAGRLAADIAALGSRLQAEAGAARAARAAQQVSPAPAAASPRTRALAVAVEQIADATGLDHDQTLFLTADRSLFAGVPTRRPLVVLAPDQPSPAKDPDVSRPRLDLFELDRAGRNAIIEWSRPGAGGGTLLLEEKDGVFEVAGHLLIVT
jgi:hypothetical protein